MVHGFRYSVIVVRWIDWCLFMHLDYGKINSEMPYLEMISKFNSLASMVTPVNRSFGLASIAINANFIENLKLCF